MRCSHFCRRFGEEWRLAGSSKVALGDRRWETWSTKAPNLSIITVAIGTREWRGFPSPVFGVREGVCVTWLNRRGLSLSVCTYIVSQLRTVRSTVYGSIIRSSNPTSCTFIDQSESERFGEVYYQHRVKRLVAGDLCSLLWVPLNRLDFEAVTDSKATLEGRHIADDNGNNNFAAW